uniref:breast cancer anti-estrogen resistance protein 1-like isoform X1 n=1 Tax=Gasterosteus aculeatus aculeatus TaxID=481459 RepID=UPI001A9907AA|nr:breast cancer anti-estrogen resistance protein 1-like isoform X1 [Gasterosteus aculeatus aculeatus]
MNYLNVLAKALYDNVAESPDELSFRKGDIMTVLERDTQGLDGWWLCSLHGRQGIVPGNRLKILVGMYDGKQQQQATPPPPEPAASCPSSQTQQRPLPPPSAYAKPAPSPGPAGGFPAKPLHSAQYTSMHPAQAQRRLHLHDAPLPRAQNQSTKCVPDPLGPQRTPPGTPPEGASSGPETVPAAGAGRLPGAPLCRPSAGPGRGDRRWAGCVPGAPLPG